MGECPSTCTSSLHVTLSLRVHLHKGRAKHFQRSIYRHFASCLCAQVNLRSRKPLLRALATDFVNAATVAPPAPAPDAAHGSQEAESALPGSCQEAASKPSADPQAAGSAPPGNCKDIKEVGAACVEAETHAAEWQPPPPAVAAGAAQGAPALSGSCHVATMSLPGTCEAAAAAVTQVPPSMDAGPVASPAAELDVVAEMEMGQLSARDAALRPRPYGGEGERKLPSSCHEAMGSAPQLQPPSLMLASRHAASAGAGAASSSVRNTAQAAAAGDNAHADEPAGLEVQAIVVELYDALTYDADASSYLGGADEQTCQPSPAALQLQQDPQLLPTQAQQAAVVPIDATTTETAQAAALAGRLKQLLFVDALLPPLAHPATTQPAGAQGACTSGFAKLKEQQSFDLQQKRLHAGVKESLADALKVPAHSLPSDFEAAFGLLLSKVQALAAAEHGSA